MDFLPMPHHLEPREGAFHLGWRTRITLQATEPSALLYAQLLRDAVRTFTGLELAILRGTPRAGEIVLRPCDALPADTYRLTVAPDGVTIDGGSDEAILHGVMTLRQWVQRHGAILPCLMIEDAPDLPNRGYYLDCSRGRVPTLALLKQYADILCQYKINQWQLYVEHTYLFRDLSEAWREDTPLTAEEIMELDAYCRARHIELVPSLSSFGHMYQILSTKTCCDLCELRDSEKIPFSYTYWGGHHTLNVSNPRAMDFIKGLIQEYMALFTSRKFNICCDETFDLAKDRSSALAEEKGGSLPLYMAHVTELCRWLLDQGITPMFWGDILWRHPEAHRDIPEGTICLNWGYRPDQREDEIRDAAQMGAVQYACPGVLTWNQWIPLLHGSFGNNQAMCRHAHKYGAIGLLNTDWGDYGHVCHPWFSLPGILYGAAFSWNSAPVDFEEINRAVSLLAYGDETGEFMAAFVDLSDHEVFRWSQVVQWIESQDAQQRHQIFTDPRGGDVAAAAPAANAALDAAIARLDTAARHMDAARRPVVQALHLSAEGVRLFNEIGLYVAAVEEHRPVAHRDGPALASDLESWFHAYLASWRAVSREGTVARTQHLINAGADYLRRR